MKSSSVTIPKKAKKLPHNTSDWDTFNHYNSFIIQHIDNKTKFEEKILSTTFFFLHSLVKMLIFTSIVGYTSCGPTYIKSFFYHIWAVYQCVEL